MSSLLSFKIKIKTPKGEENDIIRGERLKRADIFNLQFKALLLQIMTHLDEIGLCHVRHDFGLAWRTH